MARKTKEPVRAAVCPWARCNAPPAEGSAYCATHHGRAPKPPRGFSCMEDGCDGKTPSADALYCRVHEEERKAPEQARPETAEVKERFDPKAFWSAIREGREADAELQTAEDVE